MFGWWSWRIILTNILGIVAIRGIPINQPVWSFPPDMLPKPDCWAVGSGSSVVPGHNTMSHLKRKWTTTPRWRARKPHLEYNPWVAMFWVSQHLSIKKKLVLDRDSCTFSNMKLAEIAGIAGCPTKYGTWFRPILSYPRSCPSLKSWNPEALA